MRRSDTSAVEHLGGRLTTVVARVCLDMLGSRRRRVQSAGPAPDSARAREIVDAFLAASRGGDSMRCSRCSTPTSLLRADHAAVQAGAAKEVRGAVAVARTFVGRARGGPAGDGERVGRAVWAPGGRPRVVFGFTITGGRIVGIDLVSDPESIRLLDLVVLDR